MKVLYCALHSTGKSDLDPAIARTFQLSRAPYMAATRFSAGTVGQNIRQDMQQAHARFRASKRRVQPEPFFIMPR